MMMENLLQGIDVRLLQPGDAHLLNRCAPEVFDETIRADWVKSFFNQPNHYLVVALQDDLVVGKVSAVSYAHPDKPLALWINEVDVAPSHRRRGIGKAMMRQMLQLGRQIGCYEAWLGTEQENKPAQALYESVGGDDDPYLIYEWKLATGEGRQSESRQSEG